MLRKVIRRLTDAVPAPASDAGNPDAAEQPKPGGHGDHWGCVVRATEEGALLGFISDVIREAERPELFQASGTGMAVQSAGDTLRARVLVENERLVSAYPDARAGPAWQVTVTEVITWANGIEGQIKGTCHGADVAFFDTRFYANRRKYRPGETYGFHMNAFAYVLGRAADTEVETDLGAKVSLRGAHAYMPANIGNDTADIDDYWFHSPLEAEVSMAELAGRRLRGYPIIVALPEDYPMALTLYAAEHVTAPGTGDIAPGEDLEGFLWLQGYLADTGYPPEV
jgi:hypothetical protein